MQTCLFCKIAAHEISSHIVYEDEHVVAFLDIQPRTPGHTMVIPKEHATNLSELNTSEVGPFFLAVQKVTDQIKNALQPDGFTLGMNYGEVSGQEVAHMHFHIMPRWRGDGGGSIQRVVSEGTQGSKESLEHLAKKIHGTSI